MEVSRDGKLHANFSTASEMRRIVTERGSILTDQWQYVEISWHPEKDPYVHIGKQRRHPIEMSRTNVSDSDVRPLNQTSTVYLGSFDQQADGAVQTRYFHVLIDELGIWFADRDHVKAFGFLEDGK